MHKSPEAAIFPTYAPPTDFSSAYRHWAIWVSLSALGLFVGVGVAYLPLWRWGTIGITSYAYLLLPGLVYGLAQGLFLRSLRRLGWWVISTSLTSVFILLAFEALDTVSYIGAARFQFLLIIALVFALCSLPMGLAQWFLLRACFQRASWWVPATLAGWFIAFLPVLRWYEGLDHFMYAGGHHAFLVPVSPMPLFAVLGGLLAAMQAAVTGLVLVRFRLKEPAIQPASQEAIGPET